MTGHDARATPVAGDRHLMRSALDLLATTGGTAVLGLVGLYLTVRWYEPSAVGRGNSLVGAMLMIGLVAQLNLASGLPKFLAHSGSRTVTLVRNCYLVTSGLGAALAAGFVLLAPLVGPEYAFLRHGATPAVLIGGCGVWGVFALQDAVLTGLRATRWVLLENLAFGVLKLVALMLLVGTGSTGILLAWVLPVIAAVVPVNLLLFGRLLPGHAASAPGTSLNTGEVRRFVGLDFLGLVFAQAYTALLPLLVLGHLGPVTAAAFSVTWAVAFNLDMVAHNLASALTAEGARDPARLGRYSRRLVAMGTALVLTSTGVLWLVSPLLPRLLGPEYAGTAALLPILVSANLPRLVVYLYHARLRVQGRAGAVAGNQAAVGCLTVVAAELAVATGHGVTGVAWASLVGPGVMAALVTPGLLRSSPGVGHDVGPGRAVGHD